VEPAVSRFLFALLALVLWTVALPAAAAAPNNPSRTGRLIVSVVDQLGAVIQRARVTVTAQDAADAASSPLVAPTNDSGVAIVGGLSDGRYTLQVDYPGFARTIVQDIRVRGGDLRRRVVLEIEKLDQAVTVNRDRQTTALDPRGSAFSSVLTREQIDALPDDPDEMERVLKAMAPPGAMIHVDGFSGGRLPPKSQIRSIRLPKLDMFAAQNHGGFSGTLIIDIMTMPGSGPLRGSMDVHIMDDGFNARNAFASRKPEEQLRQAGFSLSGTLRPNRTSFSINGGGGSQYTSPNLMAMLPNGSTVTDTLRQPRDSFNLSARVDHAINKDHAARLGLDHQSATSTSLGVGGYNLFDRAYKSSTSETIFRLSENGPIGRRLFTESRIQLRWNGSDNTSALEEPTIRVQDAFTSGGAQQRGGSHTFSYEAASDLDYVRGQHSWRTGVLVEGSRVHADDMTNYLGTYTFASLTDYLAGRPSNYTRRIGNPDITYWTLQAAGYLQDDWRITRSLLISPGVRYGLQRHLHDAWNLSPRVSAAWSPLKSGNLTVRGSYGYFYDWVADDLYKQTLLIDGYRQREINMVSPDFPVADDSGDTAPTNRYLWSDTIDLPSTHRFVLGLERMLTKNSHLNLSYGRGWGRGLLRGQNLNAPVGGTRPDPSFANTVALASDASSRSQSFSVSYNIVRMDWRRTFFMAHYGWVKSTTNTTGAFALPANGDNLETEWGPSANDIRHRVGASMSSSPVKNLTVGLDVRAQSGLPYTITTGADDNGDGMFNDRPAGTPRNSARGASQLELGGRISYAWGFGKAKAQTGGGTTTIGIRAGDGGGGPGPAFGGGAADKRLRLEVYASGQNLLNRTNYTAYSFVVTSPFYGQPVAASQPRKVQVGMRFSF
jgi:hypothetical protein